MTVAQKTRLLKKTSVVLTEAVSGPRPLAEGAQDVRATVVENTETHAVIEVECLCGSTIQIICEYPS